MSIIKAAESEADEPTKKQFEYLKTQINKEEEEGDDEYESDYEEEQTEAKIDETEYADLEDIVDPIKLQESIKQSHELLTKEFSSESQISKNSGAVAVTVKLNEIPDVERKNLKTPMLPYDRKPQLNPIKGKIPRTAGNPIFKNAIETRNSGKLFTKVPLNAMPIIDSAESREMGNNKMFYQMQRTKIATPPTIKMMKPPLMDTRLQSAKPRIYGLPK